MKSEFSTFFGGYAKIYSLADQEGNVFYVGCTILSVEERIRTHVTRINGLQTITSAADLHMKSLDFKMIATILDKKWVTGKTSKIAVRKAFDLENEWIIKLRALGHPIKNKHPFEKLFEIKKPEVIGQIYSVSKKQIS